MKINNNKIGCYVNDIENILPVAILIINPPITAIKVKIIKNENVINNIQLIGCFLFLITFIGLLILIIYVFVVK